MLNLILIILLILLLIGALPRWQYAKDWGYASGILIGLVLIIVLILLMLGENLMNLLVLAAAALKK